MEIKLTNRLRACADFCRKGTIVCDVGTDHALLACYLKANIAKEAIASDINDGPLRAAERTAKQYNLDIKIVKSDGLDEIGYAQDIIIAGMGGELIGEILRRRGSFPEETRFILQPMTKPEILRRTLYESGFSIIKERVAYEGKRAYIIMLARYTGERKKIPELFAYTGKIKDTNYLKALSRKLERISEKSRSAEFKELASDILRYAEETDEN